MGQPVWVKTTIEISDNLLLRAKRLAKEQNTTLRSLTEEGLRMVLDQREKSKKRKIKPVTFSGGGLRPEFANATWAEIREAAYPDPASIVSLPAPAKQSKGWQSNADRDADEESLPVREKRKSRAKKPKS